MPELLMEGSKVHNVVREPNGNNFIFYKEIFTDKSPRSPLGTRSPYSESIDVAIDEGTNTNASIEQLYQNLCEMQSSDQSPSRRSYLSFGDESRTDSELRFYAGGGVGEMENNESESSDVKQNGLMKEKPGKTTKTHISSAKKISSAQSEAISKPKPPSGKQIDGRPLKIPKSNFPIKSGRNSPRGGERLRDGTEDSVEPGYLGPYLLKQAQDMVSSGENPEKSLELALRSMKAFENCPSEKPNLELVMCLHVIAALHCSLGQYAEAIPVLERSIEIPAIDEGPNNALAKFSGCMQLGDTYAMIGQIENSILFYTAGLEIQRHVLGEKDARFGETCRYVAEAHVQAFQFDEAEKFCKMALHIHKENGSPASPQEAADRRLMGLICDSKGDYEAALQHYVLASMAMAANGQDTEVASIDCSIGDAYLSLAQYDEAIFSYQKSLTVFKSTKGENHPSVASVFVRLADLYNKIGRFRESKSYCENALRIYANPIPGSSLEEIANGLTEVSAIYESMSEGEKAIYLLQKALKMYGKVPGQQSTIAGIEAQLGVLYYLMGSYSDSYNSFKSAISKFREIGEKKSAHFGVVLNQMGLVCVQIYVINEAADLFEEASSILKNEYGPFHPETLGIYSNLAGTYDAMGRSDDAIEILEYVVRVREEKLGTADPIVDDEKRRLAELLKESGRVRNRKCRSLETLLDTNLQVITN